MADPTPTTGGKTSRIKAFVSRVKLSIKKRLSKSSGQPMSNQQGQSTQEQSDQPTPTPNPQSTTNPSSTPAAPLESAPKQPITGERIAFRTTVDKEKVQALFAKYGLEFDGETVVVSALDKPGNRVQKPIRMRVRRECHQCKSTFSRSLICNICGHRYCRDCRRYPPKKPKAKSKVKDYDGSAPPAAAGVSPSTDVHVARS